MFGRQRRPIAEDTIDLWVKGLPTANPLHIVSLLGQKQDQFSEFAYYPFRSGHEAGTKPTFQEWLNQRYGQCFVVHEFPTVDAAGIELARLTAVTACVRDLLAAGATVVLVDSAGAERTARVCERLRYERLDSSAERVANR